MVKPRKHIVVFSPQGDVRLRFGYYGTVKLLIGLICIALGLNLTHLAVYYSVSQEAEQYLENLETLSVRQRAQIYSAGLRVQLLRHDLHAMTNFTNKLQVMLANEPEAAAGRSSPLVAAGSPPPPVPGMYHKALSRYLHEQLDLLKTEVRIQETTQTALMQSIDEQILRLAHTPSIWPTTGRFTSGYGYRTGPLSGKRDFHKGVDISALRNTPVFAPAAGTVIFAQRFSTYGRTIEIDHGFGIRTRYAHLHHIDVAEGDIVERGQRIGGVGSTGRSTASHLHYEVYVNEKLTDPLHYILN